MLIELNFVLSGDQRMEIYENPSEHYAAVRQLRESDNERERWEENFKILKSFISFLAISRSRSCASSSGTGSSRASRGVTSHGLHSDPAAATGGPPVNFYGYGMCHLRLSDRGSNV